MKKLVALLPFILILSCGGGSSDAAREQTLSVNTTWYIQLQGSLSTSVNVELYDVDLFDTPREVIRELKSQGKIVICYFNAGAYEDWRPDRDRFPREVIGNPMEGWEGEYWIDIRDERVREIMVSRMVLAKDKGCDGVDPDNVNGYTQNTGFDLTYEDQLDYNRFLAREAHRLGLLIGLKNDGEQVNDLVDYFDFSVQEECHQYNECDLYYPFVQRGKPVFNIEYAEEYVNNETAFAQLCQRAREEGFMTAVYNYALDGTLFKPCWGR